jgi:hypothetical protein
MLPPVGRNWQLIYLNKIFLLLVMSKLPSKLIKCCHNQANIGMGRLRKAGKVERLERFK